MAETKSSESKGPDNDGKAEASKDVAGIAEFLEQANAFIGDGKFDAAADLYRKALAEMPDQPDLLNNLGVVLRAAGKIERAIACFRNAIEISPKHADAYYNLGNALKVAAERGGAVEAYQRAIELKPDYVAAYSNLALLLKDMNHLDQAADCLTAGLRTVPDEPRLLLNLGVVLAATKRPAAAVACYRRSLALDSDPAQAWHNLAAALLETDDYVGVIEAEGEAIARDPNYAEAHALRGQALCSLGKLEGALSSLEKAIACDADNVTARLGRARVRLLAGEFEKGWEDYEWRWRRTREKPRDFDAPLWDGEKLRGRRILLHAEQGMGDTIQFLRYVPLVAARGGQPIVEVQPQLVRVAEGVAGASQVIGRGQPLPEFDVQAPLLSLPRILATRLDTIPTDIPYFHLKGVDAAKKIEDRDQIRVGLVWSGNPEHENDRNRSIPLDRFLPLLTLPDARFYGLQKGPAGRDIRRLGCDGLIHDLNKKMRDFADTARILGELDLLISVDTATAHLAGALGIPCWLLLPFAPDWRWMLERNDSPWYPSLRLYRQPAQGDWASVFTRVATDMREMAANAKVAIPTPDDAQ